MPHFVACGKSKDQRFPLVQAGDQTSFSEAYFFAWWKHPKWWEGSPIEDATAVPDEVRQILFSWTSNVLR